MNGESRKQLDELVINEIRSGRIPGLLIGVSEKGKEEIFRYGTADFESGLPMKEDTIFRIFSMSKPVCAVAAWILIERGKMKPEDPVSDFLPEFQKQCRYENGEIVPAERPVRIMDLLNMTGGFTYDDEDEPGRKTGEIFGKIHRAMDAGEKITTREVAGMLAEQLLAFTPGSRWRYGLGADVLGAVIETAGGRKLSDFYREEIFEPLGMCDTGFYVPKEKWNRFAVLYEQKEPESNASMENGQNAEAKTGNGMNRTVLVPDRQHHLGLGDFKEPPSFESAGAGLVSTYADYMKFAGMLANGGALEGVRILSEETVRGFTENRLRPEVLETVYFDQLKGYGYGNLMRVCLDGEKAPVPGTKGSFGWDGWCGPYMSADIQKKRVILFFLQVSAYGNWDFNVKLLKILNG